MQTVSPKGQLEIAEHEGIVLGPYLCSANVWTVYVGHTAAAGGLDPNKMTKVDTRGWSQEKVDRELLTALKVFDEDLETYENRVNSAVKVRLAQHQLDALVSFDLNTGGIYRAKLTAAINAHDKKASRHFMGWLKPPEIRKRREAEKLLFETGNYDANGDRIPVYDALGNGRIRHRMTISGAQLAVLMKKAGAKHTPATSIRPAWTLSGIIAAFWQAILRRN